MGGMVVFGTQRDLIVQVGSATTFPVVDVMDLTSMKADVTVGDGAGGMDRLKRATLVDRGESS